MTRLELAIHNATRLYHGIRRIGGRPALSHALGTLANLLHYGETDEELLIAGVLHDVLEDTNTTREMLTAAYGGKVTELVYQVTHDDKGNFPLVTREGFVLKMADRLDNLNDLNSVSENFKKKQVVKTIQLLLRHSDDFSRANQKLCEALTEKTINLLQETYK